LALKENQVLEISYLEKERKKVLALKKNQISQKKMNQSQLALQTIQSILVKNLQKIYIQIQKKKTLVLCEGKNLKVEATDLKTLALKNIVKKEQKFKFF